MQCTCGESVNDLMIQTHQHVSQKGVLDRYWALGKCDKEDIEYCIIPLPDQPLYWMNHVVRSIVDGVQTGLALLNLV